MSEEIFNKMKEQSKNFRSVPPVRVWNRLEYKLDHYELKRKGELKRKISYLISSAAVLVIITAVISLLKSDIKEIDIFERSSIIIESPGVIQKGRQTYNIHQLKEHYNKFSTEKYNDLNATIRVNTDIEG